MSTTVAETKETTQDKPSRLKDSSFEPVFAKVVQEEK